MSKRHLYLLALAIVVAASAAIYYKWKVLEFPLQPDAQVQTWTLQAHVEYQPRKPANTVTLQLPETTPGFTLIDERFVARNYTNLPETTDGGREVQWAIRRAVGEQDLYYRATVVRADEGATVELDFDPELAPQPEFEEPYLTAANTLLDQVRDRSSNTVTYARELLRRLNESDPGEEVALIRELHGDDDTARSNFVVQLLAIRNIPARVVHGIRLTP
ncbi:MAG: hypothetical protein CL625_02030, partial [Arenimonas sp.]|nr:hypothetical protein [Arenimonas sp.]